MRVVIANPPWPGTGYGVKSNSRWPHRRPDKYLPYPIYLAYAAAVLSKAGLDVVGMDGVIDESSIEQFADKVAKISPDLIILETATPSINSDLIVAAEIKKRLPRTHINLIGTHATVFHTELLRKNKQISSIARGEFEGTLKDLALAIKKGKTDFSSIAGLTWKGPKGKVTANKDRPPIENLDNMPYPAREIFKQDDYVEGWYKNKTFLMLSSRGCPSRCTYCLWPQRMYGHAFRARSPKNVVAEIEFLAKKYGAEEISFDDDTFTMDMRRASDICDLVIKSKSGVKMRRCFSRINTVNEELIKKLRKAGCTYIAFGIETGSPVIMKSIQKGIQLDQAKKVIKWCRAAGIHTSTTYMLGFPEETKETVRQTIDFAKALDSDDVQFSITVPYPGTELYARCERQKLLLAKSWEEFDNSHGALIKTKGLSREEVSRSVGRAYLEFYLHPRRILRILSNIRSFDDLKYTFRGAGIIIQRAIFYRSK
jgi:anaerobic magnesium-protoporphyrin IX monomethyl ester cyclase